MAQYYVLASILIMKLMTHSRIKSIIKLPQIRQLGESHYNANKNPTVHHQLNTQLTYMHPSIQLLEIPQRTRNFTKLNQPQTTQERTQKVTHIKINYQHKQKKSVNTSNIAHYYRNILPKHKNRSVSKLDFTRDIQNLHRNYYVEYKKSYYDNIYKQQIKL